jgi:hypothetical protein
MKFLHINQSAKNDLQIKELNSAIESGKDVFLLIYMEGCGPCNETRPEWKKIENIFIHKKNNPRYKNMVVVDLNSDFSGKLSNKIKQPSAFPTIIYISNKGNNIEQFEDSNIQSKSREVDSFMEWIESKINNNKNNRELLKYGLKKGGKWSQKYKRSINCRRPKGFSQKQHCKYGRNKTKKRK